MFEIRAIFSVENVERFVLDPVLAFASFLLAPTADIYPILLDFAVYESVRICSSRKYIAGPAYSCAATDQAALAVALSI
ncbi:hypothetical protein TNCV_910361 [Trichonephila clavipes]|uniref:Uncharacterized protein n=1 Tax=Trichonephila clavipes TaxID=2585209 RepID=A0A8X7BDF6_TRICX|nr:hypothetical protein TNCV_910361 [Trichonephila clavipes]